MLVTGALYQRDDRSYDDYNSFDKIDIGYSCAACTIAFFVYLILYGLLVSNERQNSTAHRYRRMFGYVISLIIIIATMIFVFVFTYEVNDKNEKDYSDKILIWIKSFGLSLLIEILVSENIRLMTTAILIWAHKYDSDDHLPTSIELTTTDRINRPGKKRSYEDEFD